MRRTSIFAALLMLAAAPAAAQIREAFDRHTARLARQPVAARAQAEDSGWTRVREMKTGRKIMIGVGTFEMTEVKFVSADDSTVTVSEPNAASRIILKADVREIRNPYTYYARKGMLWGLLGGSLVGLVKCHDNIYAGACAMFGGGVGMGIGAGIGGGMNHDAHENELIYRRAY